jgi:hypothetical protein
MAITSKTSIMPVTVPSRPSSGHNATRVLIITRPVSCLIGTSDKKSLRIW